MNKIIGMALMVGGVVFGIYAGLYWAFIGGIVDIATAIKAPEVVEMDIAIGVVKIMFAGPIGGFCALVLISFGVAIAED